MTWFDLGFRVLGWAWGGLEIGVGWVWLDFELVWDVFGVLRVSFGRFRLGSGWFRLLVDERLTQGVCASV